MFSTPGTASRGIGNDNHGLDVPTTSHKEAIDRAIKTLVKQPRVVVSEMKRDVLKEPLRRVEPRMPPRRIERTVSAPPIVVVPPPPSAAAAPVSKKLEVPPPPAAAAAPAKAPLFPAFSAPVAVAPSNSKEIPKKTEVPPPPSFTASSLAPRKRRVRRLRTRNLSRVFLLRQPRLHRQRLPQRLLQLQRNQR